MPLGRRFPERYGPSAADRGMRAVLEEARVKEAG